ncbi:TPA: hypothetical protein TVN69_001541 [Streptococcus equi subsp. zooepidemicus]|nr:hypothetical protein [Streptococcus equi subsp. zooepidemicus]HEL1230343.1 hypothetical protein [Streptococcus equi subsp. zooepidemicus]
MAALNISKKPLLKGLGLLSVCLGLAVGTSQTASAHVSTFYWNRSWYPSQQIKGTWEEVLKKREELIKKIKASDLKGFIMTNYIDTINSHVFLYKLLYLEEHIDVLIARAKAAAEAGIGSRD